MGRAMAHTLLTLMERKPAGDANANGNADAGAASRGLVLPTELIHRGSS
jgi:hypothetical protein